MIQPLRFKIWAQGDPTTGTGTQEATVVIDYPPDDREYKENARESLAKSFKTIFDSAMVHVLTMEEYEEFIRR